MKGLVNYASTYVFANATSYTGIQGSCTNDWLIVRYNLELDAPNHNLDWLFEARYE